MNIDGEAETIRRDKMDGICEAVADAVYVAANLPDDVESVIMELRETISAKDAENERLLVENRDLKRQIADIKRNLLNAEAARDNARILLHKEYMARNRRDA